MRCKRKAFTLIEMLVVLGIISLLAAVLFPVYFSAREKARQTTCMFNMKQLTVIFMQDQDDQENMWPNDGLTFRYPCLRNPYPPREPGVPGFLGFQPRGNMDQMYHITVCPSDSQFNITRDGFSYIVNGFVSYRATLRGRVANPSSTIYLVEASHKPVVPYIEPWRIYDAGTNTLNTAEVAELRSEIAVDRHHGGANYAFLDGHVKWMHFEQTVQPVSLYDIRNK